MTKWAALPALVLALGVPTTPALAQDAGTTQASSDRARIDSVTVTARKREELSQQVPLAMTALTSELQKPVVRDLSDLNGFSANVRIEPDSTRSGGINISIRGINPVRTDDNSFDPPIAVMIDGVHLGTLAGQLLENFDLERIEILRGPQGTLFGKNTTAGVVNVKTKKPIFNEWGFDASYLYGDYGRQELKGSINIPVVDDTLAFRIAGFMQESDGYYENGKVSLGSAGGDYIGDGDEIGGDDSESGRIKMLWAPTDSLSIHLQYE